MRKLLISLTSIFVMMLSVAAYADTTPNNGFRIGIVDVRQVLQKSPQVMEIQKKLRTEFGARNQQIQTAQQQLQTDVEKLNRDSSVMSANDRNALVKKAQSEQENLRTMQVNFQKDLYTKQTQEMQNVIGQMQTIIAKIAKEKNLTLVVTKDAIAYATDEMDITNDVINQMSKR